MIDFCAVFQNTDSVHAEKPAFVETGIKTLRLKHKILKETESVYCSAYSTPNTSDFRFLSIIVVSSIQFDELCSINKHSAAE